MQEVSYPYMQLYLAYISYIIFVQKVFKQVPLIVRTVDLVYAHQEWWQDLYETYGDTDEIVREQLYDYRRLAYNYMCSVCFEDDSIRDLMFIVHAHSTLSDQAVIQSSSTEDARWRDYCLQYSKKLPKSTIKAYYLAAQGILASRQPIRLEKRGDYFECHIWPLHDLLRKTNRPSTTPQSPILEPQQKPQPLILLKSKVLDTQLSQLRKTFDQPLPVKASTQPTEKDYGHIVAELTREGWLSADGTRGRRTIKSLMECAHFVDCLHRANGGRDFSQELVKRLWRDYQLVSVSRLNEYLGHGSTSWITNAQKWLK